MKKNLFSLVLLSLLSVSDGFSQDVPKDDAHYLSIVREYTLNEDGSMVYRYSKDQKLLTYRAFNAFYGETFVVYNPQYQQLKIHRCETTMADGKTVKSPPNAFNEVLPGFASGAPAFNALREMVITHTALERNAVIHLDYSILSDKGFLPALMADEVLAENEPVRSMTIRIRIPATVALSYQLYNAKQKPVVTMEGAFRIYTWRFEDIAPFSTEENQVGGNLRQPRLIFTTEQDPARCWSWFTSQEAFSLTLNDSMKAAVDDLAKKYPDKNLLALKLQEMAVNEINLSPVPMRYTGFRLRTPEEVWTGNYGTLAEKALLLTAFLRQAGMDAAPLLVFRSSFYDEKIADLSGIEDVIVGATLPEGETMRLSVSYLNSLDPAVTQCGRVFKPLVRGKQDPALKTDITPVTGSLTGNLFIDGKNHLSGELTAEVGGPVNQQYAVIRDPEKPRQWLGAGLGSRDVEKITHERPGKETSAYSFRIEKDESLKKDTLLRTFLLPALATGIESWPFRQLPSYRNSPMEVPFPVSETLNLTLTVPDNLKLFTPEQDVSIANAAGSFSYELKREGGKITVRKEIRIREKIIGPSGYVAFKTLMDNWNQPQSREILFIAE